MGAKKIRVLAFDVFGTVVDWHGSISREVKALGLDVDPNEFATRWRQGYQPAMAKVASGELEWTLIDDLHRMILDDLLAYFSIVDLDEQQKQHLNKVWHRLSAWEDSVEGLNCMKMNHTICTLSNGNLGLLTNMAKHARLPWDCVLSAEVFKKYKPDPNTYLGVCRVFDVDPQETMLVAAHQSDLDAARACGLQTAYVERRFEFGKGSPKCVSGSSENTLHARDFIDLADQLAHKY
ncbi:MAG: haloacid dehalogenase type II [Gammaproteobacteria bacterium]|nr:haloacid dehalogenase type II [Gammaproteobacteria bacterium]